MSIVAANIRKLIANMRKLILLRLPLTFDYPLYFYLFIKFYSSKVTKYTYSLSSCI